MLPRKLILSCILLFSCFRIIAGCVVWSLSTSNGISYRYVLYGKGASAVIKGDTFLLDIQGNSSCGYLLSDLKIVFNGDTIYKKAGRYEVTAKHSRWMYVSGSFDLIKAPVNEPVDTVKAPEVTSGLATIKEPNSELILFPNPASSKITITNESAEIKSIVLYNLQGQCLSSIEPGNINADLPLEKYPSGVYFVKVSTITDKIVIRKFIIQ